MNATELLMKFGSPLYVYDYNVLRERCLQMKRFETDLKGDLPDGITVSMHYSTKANSNPAILKAVKQAGLKVDCMSPLELLINKYCEFDKSEILYVCNNITREEMEMVYNAGILICLDSISQVETWGKMFPGTQIMVRINPGTSGVGHSQKVVTSGKATKFGITEENLEELFEVAAKYGVQIIGTHQHLGSLFLNDKIPDYIAGVEAGLDIVKRHFKDVQIVDLGGGFGVPYKPGEQPLDLNRVAKELKPILQQFVAEYPSVKEFKFEPGRYIPCEAGKLYGTVTAVKHENGIYWIGTDIGMNQLVRPSMYDSYHEIALPESSGELVEANFCGNVCESGDVLGKQRPVRLPEVGDPVVVYNAGAYGYSMASNYTGRARPAEVLIHTEEGDCVTIRQRQTLGNMTEGIEW